MKKPIYHIPLLLLIACSIVLTGCPDPAAPVTITLDKTSIELEEGKTETIKATVLPEGTETKIEWSSSAEQFAKVDENGKVTAIAAGNATITAKTTEGATAECTITVKAKPVTISLDKTSLELTEGQKATLTATVLPEGTETKITWSSDKPNLATVDQDGNVVAVDAGKATITATTDKGGKAECVVNVIPKVTSIELAENANLEHGSKTQLNPSFKPDGSRPNSIAWSTTNENVATVDAEGNVKAEGLGEADITVTVDGELKKTCKVKVISKITLADTVGIKAGESKDLTATVQPDPSKTISWSSDDEDVASVNKVGKVTTKKEGEATITAKTDDGASATCKVIAYTEEVTLELQKNGTLKDKLASNINYVKKLTISGELKGDDWATLKNLENLKSIDLSACTNTTIPQDAFYGMKSKDFKIVLPSGLTIIDKYAFKECSINEIEIPQTMIFDKNSHPVIGTIQRHSFESTHIGHLIISSNGVYADYSPFRGSTIDKVTFSAGLTKTPTGDLFHNKKFAKQVTIKEIVFPESLKTISANTFLNAKLPESFTLPPTIKTIEANAFKGTGLSYYDVKPAADAKIDNNAFDHKYKIELEKNSIDLVAGNTEELKATVKTVKDDSVPGEMPKITWSSSAKEYAEVDEKGNVTAKEVGTAKITARTAEGGVAECSVTVKPKTAVDIDRSKYGFKVINPIEHNGNMGKEDAIKAMNAISKFHHSSGKVSKFTGAAIKLYKNGLLNTTKHEMEKTKDSNNPTTRIIDTYVYNGQTLVVDIENDTASYTLNGVLVEEPGSNEDISELEKMSKERALRLAQFNCKIESTDKSTFDAEIEATDTGWYIQARYKNSVSTEPVIYEMKMIDDDNEVHIDGKKVNLKEIDQELLKSFEKVMSFTL